MDLQVIVN